MLKESYQDGEGRDIIFESEKSQKYREFTDAEKEIFAQEWGTNKVAFIDLIEEAVDAQGKRTQIKVPVAIFLDQREFFVPDTGGKSFPEQKELAEADAKNLRLRTGIVGLDLYIPEKAATLTQAVSQYLKETRINPLGRELGYPFGRGRDGKVISSIDNIFYVDQRKPDERDANAYIVRLAIARNR